MATFTTRELRIVAAILDVLTKARATNERMGIPTTPDVFTAQFPTGHAAVLRWTEGVKSDDPKRRRALERGLRHRPGYQLDMDAKGDPDNAIVLRDPQPIQRGREPLGSIIQGAVDDSRDREAAQRVRLGLDPAG
jgi:hypothetical protein